MLRFFFLKYVLLCVFVILISNAWANTIPVCKTKVLYINSYHVGYVWTDHVTKGIKSVFDTINTINYFTEFMDAKRLMNKNSFKHFYTYLNNKYDSLNFKYVIASDNFAVDFYFAYRDSMIFKNSQLIFTGIANTEDYPFELIDAYGVAEFRNFTQIFYSMHRLFPDRKRTHVFLDETITSYTYRSLIKKYQNLYEQPQFIIKNITDSDSITQYIKSLGKDDMVFLFNLDYSTGNRFNPYETYLKNLGTPSKVPVFSGQFDDIKGLIGGEINNGDQHGKIAAELTLKLINNEKITTRITHPAPLLHYNFKEMKRFNLDKNLLPRNSIIVNKPPGILLQFKEMLLVYYSLIILATLIIVILILNNRKLRILKTKLENTTEKAVQSESIKSSLIANISHEIRTPLNAIIGFSDILSAEIENKDLQNYIKHINESSYLLDRLVNDVLDLSLIDANEIHLNYSDVHLPTLLESLIQRNIMFIDPVKKPKLQLRLRKTEYLQENLYVDKLRLNQILQNLISNAIKYSFSGTITVNYKFVTKNEVLKLKDFTDGELLHNNYCLFSVKDHGIGIPQELKSFVFERFRRIDQVYLGHHGGVGLGLNISKSLLNIMGGKIWFDSTEKKGSTFFFIIPNEIKDI